MGIRLKDGGELDVALEVVERLGLGSGDPVDEGLRSELAAADLRWRARDAALSLLSHRRGTASASVPGGADGREISRAMEAAEAAAKRAAGRSRHPTP